jgi:hypothetical protein
MRTLLLSLILLIITGFCACSQSYLNKSRTRIERIRRWDKKYIVEKISTDSTLIYKTNDPKVKPSELVYQFNKNNKCISEAYIEECEECYQEHLLKVIGTKHSKWKMIDSARYVYKNMELRTHYEGKPYAFVISVVQ